MPAKKVAPKKVAAKKPVAKKAIDLFTKIITIVPNWDKIPVGSKFTGTLSGTSVSGRVQKEDGCIYLCHDVRECSGGRANDRLGYEYSYNIGDGTHEELQNEDVTIKTITLDPAFQAPITIDGKSVIFKKGSIVVGCTTVPNATVKKIASMLQ